MLTIDEVRSRLRVSASTIRRLVRDAKLPAYRVGGQLRFKATEVAAYIEEQRVIKMTPR
jgi:excisionase family DNA binding protein